MTEVKPASFDISKALVSLKGKKKFDELSNNDIVNLIQIDFKVNSAINDFEALKTLLPLAKKVKAGTQLSDDDKAQIEMILQMVQELKTIDLMAALPEDDKKTEAKPSGNAGAGNQNENTERIKQSQVNDLVSIGLQKSIDGDLQGAIDDFTKAIKLNGLDKQVYRGRGNVYLQLEQFENALRDYNQHILLNSDSNSPEDFFVRGRILESLNRFEEALADYQMANDLNDENDTHRLKTTLDLAIKVVSEKIETERAKAETKTEEQPKESVEEDDDSIQITGNDNIHNAIQSDIKKGTSKLRRVPDTDLIAYFAMHSSESDMGQLCANGKPEDVIYVISKLNDFAVQAGIPERICGVQILFAKTIEFADPNSWNTWAPVVITKGFDYREIKQTYDKDHATNLKKAVQQMGERLLARLRSQQQPQQK